MPSPIDNIAAGQKALVPQIRFRGFTDAWEQRRLGELLTESRVCGSKGDYAKKITVKLWGKGVVPKTDSTGSSATQYYRRKSGQLIYSKLDFSNGAFGIIPENMNGYESTLDLPCFDLGSANGRFLFHKITQKSFYIFNGRIANGSRKAKRIHVETFLDISMDIPSIHEQERIGLILDTVCRRITLHQRELKKLKNIKKGLLEKLFPKEGSKYPEARFRGFTDAWEQRPLSYFFYESRSRSNTGQLLSVTIAKGVIKASENNKLVHLPQSLNSYKAVEKGDLIYNTMRMWQGASGYSHYSGIISPAYTVLKPTKRVDSLFFSYIFKLESRLKIFTANSQGLTSDTWNLKYCLLGTVIESKPQSLTEQNCISRLISTCDRLITLHQRKITKLENIKKALLEKMFV